MSVFRPGPGLYRGTLGGGAPALLSALLLLPAAGVAPASAADAEDDARKVERLEATVSTMQEAIDELKRELAELKAGRAEAAAQPTVPGVAPRVETVAAPPPVPATTVTVPASTVAVSANAAAGPATTADVPATTAYASPQAAVHPEAKSIADRHEVPSHRETINQENVAAPRPGNAPLDPSYAGFVRVPATNTWLRLGGYAKVDTIVDSTKVGNPNKFATSGIPVDGEANHGTDEQFNIHAKQTRANLELRSPTPLGALRVVYENDFFGNSTSADMSYNLRHFYGQVANFTAGQTWTAFYDPDAAPDTLDLAGPGMQSQVRQPQLRYTHELGSSQHVALSVEQSSSDVGALASTASDRNVMPDFAAFWRGEGSRGHVQIGALARALSYEDTSGPEDSAFGWGLNLSSLLHAWGKDSITARLTYGDGIGRYMQDLPSGSAAVVDASGNLETLEAWGAMIGYRHQWSERWRSELTYGHLDLNTREIQGDKAYANTDYGQFNLVWAPTRSFYLGLEYLYGTRTTRDGSDGAAHRAQFSVLYQLMR